MREPMRTLGEAVAILVAATVVACVANAVHPNGLSFTRDYFQVRGAPAALPGGPGPANPAGTDAPAATELDAVKRRIEEAGLHVIDHEDVVALFRDELYAEGAYSFVDARNEESFEAGHIPGAWPFDHYHYERTIDAVMNACRGSIKVVVYCYGRDCTDSELAARLLINFGLDPATVFVYVGGISAWKDAGLPIEEGARKS